MRKFTLTLLITGLLSVFAQPVNAQDKKEQIAKVINDYFFLERENIHVHFNKNIFLSNESIWFKGYVFHRKHNIPFYSSINIFASIIDEQGNIIETKLLYGDVGSFSGSFALGDNFKSGKYYVQFYTNWMNNFTEDESAIYDITIINEAAGIPENLIKRSYTDININLQPEGGILLQQASNIIGISVKNCNNEPTKATEAEIIDNNGQIIKTVPLTKSGYGKFDFTPKPGLTYKAVVNINGSKYEQTIMPAQVKGVILETNTYTIPDKTTIKVLTNEFTVADYSNKPLYITIHKDDKSVIFEINFSNKNPEQSIILANTDLFEGLNTIRILDENLNQLAERLIYIHPATEINTELNKGLNNSDGQVEFSGTINKPNMNLSIAVLPEGSLSINDDNDILADLLISPYLKECYKFSAGTYLNKITRGSKYELDLFLLNQQSKYAWNNIKSNPPKQNHTFEMGLEVKGKINQNIKSPKNYKVRVLSYSSMIDETVDVNEKNEFSLKNLILLDSTSLNFTLLKNGEKPVPIKLYPQIINNNRKFTKTYKPKAIECNTLKPETTNQSVAMPKYITKSITLDEITIEGSKTKLKYEKAHGNSQLRAYKISEADTRGFMYILDFIRYHGFNVTHNRGEVSITGRNITSINGQATQPMIYIDNIRVLDYSQLIGIYTEDVDEFYINPHAIVPSVDNKMGIIRIYLKKGFGAKKTINNDVSFLIKDGFETPSQFKNAEYSSTTDDPGFENFGLIDWHPTVVTDENGNFKINIPNIYSGEVKVVIEGFSPDGKLISEVKTIML